MNNDTLSAETHWIITQLAQFDGVAAMKVVARHYARFAQGGTGFHQLECDFLCDRVPEALRMPVDADEVTITMNGALADAAAKPRLKKAVEDALAVPSFSTGWDVRVYFDSRQQGAFGYQIKVFTTQPS